MRKLLALCTATAVFFIWAGAAQSGDDDGRAIVNKAIEAAGGAKNLARFQSFTFKGKGVSYYLAKPQEFTEVTHVKYPFHIKTESSVGFISCVDGDKGWSKLGNRGVEDMDEESLAGQLDGLKRNWITSLLPLKDKAFTVKKIDGGDKHHAVTVSRKYWPTVKLFFDKKTNLLVKSEHKRNSVVVEDVKEVTFEDTFSKFKEVNGCTFPHHWSTRGDGKIYMEFDVTEWKAVEHDAKTFAKPAAN